MRYRLGGGSESFEEPKRDGVVRRLLSGGELLVGTLRRIANSGAPHTGQ